MNTPSDRHDHDHGHSQPHTAIGQSAPPGYYEIMETAVRELLIERKLIGADEIRRQIEVLDSRTPALGAKVVARAWVDPDFKARLLANGRAARVCLRSVAREERAKGRRNPSCYTP